jgi:hypothetical protein
MNFFIMLLRTYVREARRLPKLASLRGTIFAWAAISFP